MPIRLHSNHLWTTAAACIAACCAMSQTMRAESPSAAAATSVSAAVGASGTARPIRVYVGTYTRGDSRGIYLFEMDPRSGQLSPQGLAAEAVNPSFVALHPNRRFLYSVSEVANQGGERTGGVSAFSIIAGTGKLELLNQQPSGGAGPCYLVVDHAAKNVLVANYGGGSVAALPIGEDGRLSAASSTIQHAGSSVNPRRQEGPHAHSINVDRQNRFAVAADLGLDKLLVYRFDAEAGTLTPNDPPSASVSPGSGPRHFAFHPSGRFAYVINEIFLTVTAFAWDAERGVLTPIETVSTLPEGVAREDRFSTAEVQVHPSGRFLYGSNRGHDTIAMFRIDQQSGRLTPIGHESTQGEIPRNFGIDPDGRFLLAANQNSHTVVAFRIDEQTGLLKATGQKVEVPSPVCVKFLKADY